MPLVEAIPNISEGRRQDVIDACALAVRRGGARLLDVHTDPDHNRSVFTFAGSPDDVRASALALVHEAVARIDLRTHRGVHPRMGAVDVLPFVPLAGLDPQVAVALARDVGAQIAADDRVPVYLYELAASNAGRARLEVVRQGGFEALASRMAQPGWAPDFGPLTPHPSAGVVAVGARHPLVAFNVVLDTDRLDVAREIARRIRERDGGLPAVKALGLPLASRHLVQVSMNLVNYGLTTPLDVFTRIATEAAALGVAIKESELIGLAPAAALPPDPAAQLRLAGPPRHYALEDALTAHGLQA